MAIAQEIHGKNKNFREDSAGNSEAGKHKKTSMILPKIYIQSKTGDATLKLSIYHKCDQF